MIDILFSPLHNDSMDRQKGQTELFILLGAIVLFAIFISGGLFPKKFTTLQVSQTTGQCCENGDGANCTLVASESFLWKLDEYQLLKRGIRFVGHLNPAHPPDNTTPNGDPIFLNQTEGIDHSSFPGCEAGKDKLYGPNGCVGIPNDAIIYVCKSDCSGSAGTAVFDAYYRVRDLPIPDSIKNCVKPGGPNQEYTIVEPLTPQPSQPSLQLNSMNIRKVPQDRTPWLSPYCKPAIYLYPQEKTSVNIKIAPQGKLTLTIPTYPMDGWQVTAYPSGNITYNNSFYNYLYYEAEITDTLIEKPKEGFVVEHSKLTNLFTNLLPKLGLNEKESSQFSQYWLKALPKSPFYFVGIIPTSSLNKIAPITINPSPNTLIRVTLYFQPLDGEINVSPPLLSPVKRDGFTVVEWGGIVKTDPSHPFSCLM